jgi:FkbH-like protein
MLSQTPVTAGPAPVATVKCLVWDLDDTLWDGVLLEGDRPRPFPDAVRTLRTLDERGILHAVASRGDHDAAVRHLTEHGLAEMFCVLEIGWAAKSAAVRRIADTLNIGLESLAFVDNDAVERAEVAHTLPMLRCYPAEQVARLGQLTEFTPPVRSDESGQRRQMYLAERRRSAAAEEHGAGSVEFLAGLDLTMTVRPATERDLARAHELTVRTHQLNTTGLTYDMARLRELCHDPGHEVVVASLTDRFGAYGTIGLAVSELTDADSVLKLMLMSCRVASRGAGTALLDHLVRAALAAGRRPVAHFVPSAVNRGMLVTLRFAGYRPVGRRGERLVLAVDPRPPGPPRTGHVRVLVEGTSR